MAGSIKGVSTMHRKEEERNKRVKDRAENLERKKKRN